MSRSARIEACLEPQERFEALRAEASRLHGRALVDLSYANATEGPPASVRSALAAAVADARPADLQYTPYGGATITRREIARSLGESHGARFHYRDVVLTPGAMAALNVAFRVAEDDLGGAEVIVVTPCWLDYPLYLAHLGIAARLVPTLPDLHLDLDAIRGALGPRTCAVVLSQPANPSGIIYGREELTALGHLLDAAPRRPLLVSDECHRDVVHDGITVPSPLAFYDRTLVVYSFGKSLFMQGQRIGFVAVSPRMADREDVSIALERACRYMGFCTPTGLMQITVRSLVGKCEPDALATIARRRARVAAALRSFGYALPDARATFFLYPAVPGDGDDLAFCARLARDGVLALPAAMFHHRGHFRLSLTASDEVFDRALPVLARAAS